MATLAVTAEVEVEEKIPTSLKQVGVRRDYQMINPRLIDIEPGFNARDYTLPENRAHLDRLKLLIVAAGRVNEPITVRLNRETGRATVVDGECRLRSTRSSTDSVALGGTDLASCHHVPGDPLLAYIFRRRQR